MNYVIFGYFYSIRYQTENKSAWNVSSKFQPNQIRINSVNYFFYVHEIFFTVIVCLYVKWTHEKEKFTVERFFAENTKQM